MCFSKRSSLYHFLTWVSTLLPRAKLLMLFQTHIWSSKSYTHACHFMHKNISLLKTLMGFDQKYEIVARAFTNLSKLKAYKFSLRSLPGMQYYVFYLSILGSQKCYRKVWWAFCLDLPGCCLMLQTRFFHAPSTFVQLVMLMAFMQC